MSVSHTRDEIRQIARERGLGELTDIELEFVDCQEQYILYARDEYVPLSVIRSKRAAWERFWEATTEPERVNNICSLYQYLTGSQD